MRSFRPIALAAALLLLPALGPAHAAGDHGLEQVLIESASTPAQHLALAEHFRAKAAQAKREAEGHRSMAKSYVNTKAVAGPQSAEHCTKAAESYDALAAQYEQLAAEHEAQAKK
jgi:hypothetical protein